VVRVDSLTIRSVRDADWPALLALAEKSVAEMPSAPSQREWASNRRSFPTANGVQRQFIATADGQVVGYAGLEHRGQWMEDDYRLFVVVVPSDRDSLGIRLLALLRSELLQLQARRAWFLEYESLTQFNSWLESQGFMRVESFNLGDGTSVVRMAMDAPFEHGGTVTWPGANRDRLLGQRFSSARMVENYLFRPPYSPEVFETLLGFIKGHPRVVLDAGCGPGKTTLGLIDNLERADAIDPSAEMLRLARSLPNGANAKIRWIESKLEDSKLDPPYGLIVAALSLHWMDLDQVLPKFAAALAPGAFLAVLDGDAPINAPWERDETAFYSDFLEKVDGKRPFGWKNARQQLDQPKLLHRLYKPVGVRITQPTEISQTIVEYLRCQHSRATWSEDHLGNAATADFDAGMEKLLSRYVIAGHLHYVVQTRIEWGHLSA